MAEPTGITIETLTCVVDGCGWSHTRVPPPVGDDTLAGVFGRGVMSAVARAQELEDTERALADHRRSHTPEEFLTTIARLREALGEQLNTAGESASDPEPVHGFFGLTYANYLVLHRTLMQSMPAEWQGRMVACLRELDDAFAHVEKPEAFHVEPGVERFVGDLTSAELALVQVTRTDEEDGWSWHDRSGTELHHETRVVVPERDPVPHYDRGRARVQRRGDAS